jgi:hypothetical protein
MRELLFNVRRVIANPVVILLLLTGLFFSEVLSGERFFLLRDTVMAFADWKGDWRGCVHEGAFPFWDKIGTGKPYLGDPWIAALYPANLLYLALPFTMAINWQNLLHVFGVGLAVYVFLRQFKLVKLAALMSAMGVMFSTWLMAYMEFTVIVVVPWLFFMLAVLVRLGRDMAGESRWLPLRVFRYPGWLSIMACLIAVAFMANYFEFFIYGFIMLGILSLVVGWCGRNIGISAGLSLFIGVAGLIAILLVLPELGTIWQFLPFSTRSDGGAGLDNRFWMASLTPSHLLNAIFPMIGGRPGFPDTFWAKGTYEFWVGTFYTGALAILALPFAFLKLKSGTDGNNFRLPVLFGSVLVVIGLVLAMGENTPVYPWVWEYVPIMNKFRFAAKFLFLVITGEVILTAVGLQFILSPVTQNLRRAMWRILWAEGLAVLFLGLLAGWIYLDPAVMKSLFNNQAAVIRELQLEAVLPSIGLSYLFLVLAYGWLILILTKGWPWLKAAGVALVFVNLLVVSKPILPTAPAEVLNKVPQVAVRYNDPRYRIYSPYTTAQQYFYGDDRADIYMWGREAGVGLVWNPYPGVILFHQHGGQLSKFQELLGMALADNEQVSHNFLDAAGVRWMVGGEPWPQILWGKAKRDLVVTERTGAIPRFALYAEWQPVVSDEVALRYLATVENGELHRRPAIEETVLLNGRENTQALPPPIANPSAGKVELLQEKNSSLKFKVQGASPQLFVVSDTWYPGWKATVDGREAPIYRANYMFRGVFVPAGEHVVRFDYWPNNFGWYCAASALGVLIVGGLLVSHWWPKRRKD